MTLPYRDIELTEGGGNSNPEKKKRNQPSYKTRASDLERRADVISRMNVVLFVICLIEAALFGCAVTYIFIKL